MEIGLLIPLAAPYATREFVAALGKRSEEAGFDLVSWTNDDAWSVLTTLENPFMYDCANVWGDSEAYCLTRQCLLRESNREEYIAQCDVATYFSILVFRDSEYLKRHSAATLYMLATANVTQNCASRYEECTVSLRI